MLYEACIAPLESESATAMSDNPNKCPKCGCALADSVVPYERGGLHFTRRVCHFCSTRFVVEEKAPDAPEPTKTVVTYPLFVCPFCGARKPRTTSTRGNHRFHKCRKCGEVFQSLAEEFKGKE